MTVYVDRFKYADFGTFSVLRVGDKEWFALERPLGSNRPGVDCIPEGEYRIRLDTFKGKYPNFRVVNPPPGRSDIEIHRGNRVEHTRGCILPGLSLHTGPQGRWFVGESTSAMDAFMAELEGIEETDMVVRFKPLFEHRAGKEVS